MGIVKALFQEERREGGSERERDRERDREREREREREKEEGDQDRALPRLEQNSKM